LDYAGEAAEITFGKIGSWEELNAATEADSDQKFKEATRKYWKEFAVPEFCNLIKTRMAVRAAWFCGRLPISTANPRWEF